MTEWGTDPLRVRFEAEYPPAPGGCPPAERIWEASAGELPFEATSAIIDHTAHCSDCARAWKLALVMREQTLAEVTSDRGRLVPLFRPSALVAGGVGLAALAAVGILVLRGTVAPGERPSQVAFRGDADRIRSLTPPGPQPHDAIQLRWNAYPGAQRYSVTVVDSSFKVLFRAAGLAGTELRIPEGTLEPGRVFWSVSAYLPDDRIVESEAFTLDVR
jgi:hypothetical protein